MELIYEETRNNYIRAKTKTPRYPKAARLLKEFSGTFLIPENKWDAFVEYLISQEVPELITLEYIN